MSEESKDPSVSADLTDEQRAELEDYAKALAQDYQMRVKMLLNRFDVTLSVFLDSPRLEPMRDQILKLATDGKAGIQVPEPATLDEALAVDNSVLDSEKVYSSAKTKITEFRMTEIPPTRGGNQDALVAGAAEAKAVFGGFRGRGRGGHRGRGQHQNQTQSLQHDMNRQLHVSHDDSPQKKKARGKRR